MDRAQVAATICELKLPCVPRLRLTVGRIEFTVLFPLCDIDTDVDVLRREFRGELCRDVRGDVFRVARRLDVAPEST